MGGFPESTVGLPEWFGQNIDSHCLAAAGGTVVFGAEGRLFVSEDGGASWRDAGTTYPEITCVAVTAAPKDLGRRLRVRGRAEGVLPAAFTRRQGVARARAALALLG